MEFGWRVPSYAGPLTTAKEARSLVPYFARVEEAGFSGLWVIDHLLVAPNVYSVAWQDPMITLAVAAGATERIRLGTAILCAPFRHPTIIAKEVASLDSLSGGGRVDPRGSAPATTTWSSRRWGCRGASVADAPTRRWSSSGCCSAATR